MNHLYCRLAMTNLKNNRQFYLPYILMGTVSAMMFYIMRAIQGNDGIGAMRGAGTLKILLFLGVVIVGACTCIFLFYANSFVMKRRKKELGIYNILGMEKKHIAKVMAWEAAILYGISVGGGLAFGIIFNKLVAMFLFNLTGLSESIPFYVSGWGCWQTVELFAIMHILMLLYNFLQVKLANPIELLRGSNVGEREPKVKWISTALGIVCILAGYYLAIDVHGIIEAVNMFFVAIILVIIGTYELFMAVSIAFCKLLKRNKGYYYKMPHFITISGMIYRMKRNAIGLANICILSTMVLVMISTTVCLYAGLEDSLQDSFRKEIVASLYCKNVPDDAAREYLLEQAKTAAEKQGRKLTEMSEYAYEVFVAHIVGNRVELYDNASYDLTDMGMLYVMTKKDYEKYTGEKLDSIAQGSVMVASLADFGWNGIELFGQEYPVTGKLNFPADYPDGAIKNFWESAIVLYVIVPDDSELEKMQKALSGGTDCQYRIEVETDGTWAERKAYASAFREALDSSREQLGFVALVDSRAEQREGYMELNGGFFFLGLFLGSMFLMVTVLIIYYKQISEGFEDRERFAIMAKVGMSRDMVQAAINAQVLTVFFMPITVAVIHLVMAFPMLKLMLLLFGLNNTSLFIGCMAATTAVFAIIYFIVFKLTSRSYYKIVYR